MYKKKPHSTRRRTAPGNEPARNTAPVLAVLSAILWAQALGAAPQQITVTGKGFDETEWVRPDASISLQLSQPSLPSDGRIAVLVGNADLTPLFRPTAPGELTFDGRDLPLPSGESQVKVFWVGATEEWEELASLPIKVLTPSGFETAEWTPRAEASSKSQFNEEPRGDVEPSERGDSFADGALQAGFETQHARGDLSISSSANFVGFTEQSEALRFGEEGDSAPKFDMSDYRVDVTHVVRGADPE